VGLKTLVLGPAKSILAAARWQKAALTNASEPVPIFTTMRTELPNGLKVHLGAGDINLQGWVNVDARAFGHIHARTASLELAEFTDGAVSAIYLCHVLEHLSFDEVDALVRVWHRKLAPGGVLFVSVPDFDAIVRIYQSAGNDLDAIKHPLMGGQGYEYNFHKSVYNERALARVLEAGGFRHVERWDTAREFGSDLGDWSSRSVAGVPISLNLKTVKDAGRS